MPNYSILQLEEGEKVILEVRRHWIVFVGHIVALCVMIPTPIFLYILLLNYFPALLPILTGTYFHVYLFFYVLWVLFLWIGFFLAWTKFFLDVWYVTGSRIIAIEQQRIFHRLVSNLRFDRIQDITIDVNGFVATFLNFGNIRVQTASESEDDFYMMSVKDPENVKRIIFAQHNIVGDSSNRSQLP